ncbi:hypothetical protein [Acidicapsa acidisoli]|uniref:hypothetical protein n=1 Tax=Acidicapsa acidisoli TaxID=1615681 RepID=UPI0021DFB612|nr:hypothetical protein [Acidicapsa acidisoli]
MPFFQKLMTTWIAGHPSAARLALGAIVHEKMNSRQDAYRRLAKYLPAVTIDADGSSELAYQINRPRQSKVALGLQINRLSKWSANLFVPFGFSINNPAQAQMERLGDGETTCRIELDINTDPAYVEGFSQLIITGLTAEFCELAMEITEFGDIQ